MRDSQNRLRYDGRGGTRRPRDRPGPPGTARRSAEIDPELVRASISSARREGVEARVTFVQCGASWSLARSEVVCVRGTRITVGDVLSYLASGMREDEILADFPQLTRDDIRACLAFAA